MAIDPKLLVIKPVDELARVTGLQEGDMLFYDGGDNLKRISIDTFNNLSQTAKPLSPTDVTPTMPGLYAPTSPGTYANAGGLIVQEGYYTLFFFDGTTWTKTETKMPSDLGDIKTVQKTFSEIQSDIGYDEGSFGIVTNEPNPNRNGVYIKIGGVGSGGWAITNFNNPLFIKSPDLESMAIGGGQTSIFSNEPGQGQGHTAFGFEAGLNLGNCWATTLFGWKAGRMLSTASKSNTWSPDSIGNTGNSLFGYNVATVADGMLDCSYFGTSAGQNSTTCMDNAGFGIWALRLIEGGSENAAFGHLSLGYLIGKGTYLNVDNDADINPSSPNYSWGHRNVGVGDKAGALDNGGNALNYVKKCVYVGAKTTGSSNYVVNENVFGYMAQGRGSNTVMLGNLDVKETSFNGILRNWTDRRFADLPTPNRDLVGSRSFILDANTRIFDAVTAGGGSNLMPVWCDGSSWRIG